MLGLGDIVIPGVFVALCLRFDEWKYTRTGKVVTSKCQFAKPYFIACFIAYAIGLVTTVVVMHTFQAAQPALLYLSPACILSVLLTALVRGELPLVFEYKAEEPKDVKKTEAAKKGEKKEGKKEKNVVEKVESNASDNEKDSEDDVEAEAETSGVEKKKARRKKRSTRSTSNE